MNEMAVKFRTAFKYHSREDKPEYVWRKYGTILTESALDVGADKGGLRKWLPDDVRYVAVGFGDGVNVEIDLEKGVLPFSDGEFNCVLCLDVLEHLENIHGMFDELCRVSGNYVIISLPNPWKDFIRMLRHGFFRGPEKPMKFYNLPVDPPEDRHRWFFSPDESEKFLRERGKRNGMKIIQIDYGRGPQNKRPVKEFIYKLLLHRDITVENVMRGTQWTVLQKEKV